MSKLLTFIVLFVAILAVRIMIQKTQSKKGNNFDERQLMLRSRAYQRGFMTILGYSVFYALATMLLEKSFMQDGVSTLIGAFIGLIVFAVECIWNDAFFYVQNKPSTYLIICAIVVISNGLAAIDTIKAGELIQNGILTSNCLQLVCAVTFLVIAVAIIVKLVFAGQEDE